jgi:phenylalanyl-tRNA synthetase beta chain
MILSHRWLMRHLPGEWTHAEVADTLEQMGLEIASLSTWGDLYQSVELVEVSARAPHPNSDHLSLVQVRRGNGDTTQVVTGAANGFVGDRLWYAPPGAILPDGRTLEVRDLRGVASPGMLLSPEELGYQAYTGDLWVWDGSEALGTTFLQAIGGADTLYEVELTPNIAQYLQSVRHVAAELAAIKNRPLNPGPPTFSYGSDSLVGNVDSARCPLYGVVRLSLKPQKASPLWMQTLLRAAGHRIIHPAVDVTNFVLWDLGEPLHAFDARQVSGPIQVRTAAEGETLTLLDGHVLNLSNEDLVIADREKALALAGIMGGERSGIADDTTEVLLECAHFSSLPIYRSMKAHGLMTDAAQHFGRGTDPGAVLQAPSLVIDVLRAAGILAGVDGSSLVGSLEPEREVSWSPGFIRRLLGTDWSDDQISQALTRLGYRLEANQAVVPRYRHDVESAYDLAEDVGRYYSLNSVPRTLPVQTVGLAARGWDQACEDEVRDVAAAAGYDEVMTRTFVSPELNRGFGSAGGGVVTVTNPLREDESAMRTSILPSLLEVVRYNRSRHDLPIRIFEVGAVFEKVGGQVVESRELGVVLSLEPIPALPKLPDPSVYDLTALVDYVKARLGLALERREYPHPPRYLHPGRVQEIAVDGVRAGYVGELRPRVAAEYRVRRLAVLVLRLPEGVKRHASKPGRPSRFPEVQRDLSVVVPDRVRYADIERAISQTDAAILRELRPIDRFAGEFGNSLTIRLTFQSDEMTLTDERVDATIAQIVAALAEIGVEMRQ